MSSKQNRSQEFKRAIDMGQVDLASPTDLVKIWRIATGDEKAITLEGFVRTVDRDLPNIPDGNFADLEDRVDAIEGGSLEHNELTGLDGGEAGYYGHLTLDENNATLNANNPHNLNPFATLADLAQFTPVGDNSNSYKFKTFTSETSVVFEHDLGEYPIVQVIDNEGKVLIPNQITHDSTDQVTVTFTPARSGTIILVGLGSGECYNTDGFLVVPFTSQTSVTINHDFGKLPLVQVVNENGNVRVPLEITHESFDTVTVTFTSEVTGNILLAAVGETTCPADIVPPVAGEYASEVAMIADQGNQLAQYIYFDGTKYWEYLGTTNGSIVDYRAWSGGDIVQPNGLVQIGTYTQDVNDITVNPDWIWRFNQVIYQKTTTTDFTIAPSAVGFTRIDLVYGNTSEDVLIVTGTEVEDPDPAVPPAVPANSVGFFLVFVNNSGISGFQDFALSSFVRFDVNNQNLSAVQRQNARTNIQAVSRDVSDTITSPQHDYRDSVNNLSKFRLRQGAQGSERLFFLDGFSDSGLYQMRFLFGVPQTGLGSMFPNFRFKATGTSTRTFMTWLDGSDGVLFSMIASGAHLWNGNCTRNGTLTQNGNTTINGQGVTSTGFLVLNTNLNDNVESTVVLNIQSNESIIQRLRHRGDWVHNFKLGNPDRPYELQRNGATSFAFGRSTVHGINAWRFYDPLQLSNRSTEAIQATRRDELHLNYSQSTTTSGQIDNQILTEAAKMLLLNNADSLTGVDVGTGNQNLGRKLVIYNARASGDITIKNNDTDSDAANRFDIGSDFVIPVGKFKSFIYIASRWRIEA